MTDKRVEPLSVPGLDPRIRAFRCGRMVDSFAVVTDSMIVVVDTMVSPETAGQVWNFIDPHGENRPVIVVNTHGDWDHAWGNAYFDGPRAQVPAPIIGHGSLRRSFEWDRVNDFVAQMREKEPGAYDSVEVRLPTIEIEQSATIWCGGLSIHLIPTPGHTPDHLALWIPELRVLIAGDAAEMPVPFIGDRSDVGLLRESLVRMESLDPEFVLYCHGGGFFSPDLIGANIRYFDECEAQCRGWLAQGKTEPPTPESLNWPMAAVMPETGRLGADEVGFYESSHRRAIGAIWRWLQTVGG